MRSLRGGLDANEGNKVLKILSVVGPGLELCCLHRLCLTVRGRPVLRRVIGDTLTDSGDVVPVA
jgi:hypothetical protein